MSGCDKGCEGHTETDLSEMWGYDVDINEEVNLLHQVPAGRTAYDEEWNIVTEHTADAVGPRRRLGLKPSRAGDRTDAYVQHFHHSLQDSDSPVPAASALSCGAVVVGDLTRLL